MNRDEHIKQLVLLLDDIFNFLEQSSDLNNVIELTRKIEPSYKAKANAQIHILALIFQQTTECAYFIQGYVQDTSYCEPPIYFHGEISVILLTGKRMIKHTTSEVDIKIQSYQDKFSQLKSDFQDYTILHTQINVLQVKFISLSMSGKLDDIGKCGRCQCRIWTDVLY